MSHARWFRANVFVQLAWFRMVFLIYRRYLGVAPGAPRWGEIAREAEFFMQLPESSDEDADSD